MATRTRVNKSLEIIEKGENQKKGRSVKDLRVRFKKFGDVELVFGPVGPRGEADYIDPDSKRSIGASVAQVANWHELGQGVPQRSWHRATLHEQRQRLFGIYGRGMQDVMRGKKVPRDVLDRMGVTIRDAMRKKIVSRISPELAEATKARASRDPRYIPLYDTQQIYRSISFEIRGKRD